MNSQPLLPVREEPKTLDYSPGGEADPGWIIGDWRGISATFDLRPHEAADWHVALAGQGRPWLVIRRLFSVAPEWGAGLGPDDMRTWKAQELAEALGVSEAVLRRDLENAVEFWKKARMSISVTRTVQASTSASTGDAAIVSTPSADAATRNQDDLPSFQFHQTYSEEEINAILTPFRFHHIKATEDRLYVANRILELRKLMEDKYRRESARQLIIMEMGMANYEATIGALKARLATIQKSSEITASQAKEIQEIGKSITEQEKALTALSTTYQKAADELGGDEIEAGEARRLAVGTVSHLVEAHRRYYETGERVLIDGMFTADELVWLTTPLSIRPAQYRPDVVLRVREACQAENLWAKDYQPSTIQREACRRLLKLAQAMADEMEPEAIEGIDDANIGDVRDEDDPADAASVIVSDQSPSAQPDYIIPATPRAEEPFMATS